MRITVNLSLFFHDHRSVAKIFVNKKMKCIKDVEDHISSIFKIKDFYLKCENQYLPPTEDVQILQYDDIAWAVPMVQECPTISEEEVLAVQKKKKKKATPLIEESLAVINEDVAVQKKKKKKQKHDEQKKEDIVEADDVPFKPKKKKKPPLIIGDATPKTHENVTKRRKLKSPDSVKDSGRDSLSGGDSGNVSVRCLVNNFESKISTGSFSELKEPEKRTNIVKTIIISNGRNDTDDSKCDNVESEQKQTNLDTDFSTVDILSPLETSSVACSSLTETDINVNKRKRKRTRKRKSRQDLSTTFQQPVYNFIHKPLIVQTPSHVRFHEEPENQNVEEAENQDVDIRGNTKTEECPDDIIEIESESVSEGVKAEKPDEMETEKTIEASVINLENGSFDNKELEECIRKQPITQNTEPKLGDIIAFKILRISENYTPEVSSTIVGKVLEYTAESKEIDFGIIYGHQQCSFPNGKFSLDPEEPPDEISKLHCSWSSLLEPRLLYP